MKRLYRLQQQSADRIEPGSVVYMVPMIATTSWNGLPVMPNGKTSDPGNLFVEVPDDEPLLGLATTRQMIESLVSIFHVDAVIDKGDVMGKEELRDKLKFALTWLTEEELNYRTVDEH